MVAISQYLVIAKTNGSCTILDHQIRLCILFQKPTIVMGIEFFSICGPKLWNNLPLSLKSMVVYISVHHLKFFDYHICTWLFKFYIY